MLLINPSGMPLGGSLNHFVPASIPMALGNLASVMLGAGRNVAIFDEELVKISDSNVMQFVEKIEKPYIFGLSILTAHASRAYELAKYLKGKFPGCVVVAGGYHATALPDEALKTGIP